MVSRGTDLRSLLVCFHLGGNTFYRNTERMNMGYGALRQGIGSLRIYKEKPAMQISFAVRAFYQEKVDVACSSAVHINLDLPLGILVKKYIDLSLGDEGKRKLLNKTYIYILKSG